MGTCGGICEQSNPQNTIAKIQYMGNVENQIKMGLQMGDEGVPITNLQRNEEVSNQTNLNHVNETQKRHSFKFDEITTQILLELVLDLLHQNQGPFLLDNDRMVRDIVGGNKFGQINQFMKENGLMTRLVEKGNCFMLMVICMKVNGLMIKLIDLGDVIILIDGKRIRWMEQEEQQTN